LEIRALPTLVLGLLLGGCSYSPSIIVLGAYFPDWMFCIVGSVILIACIHGLIRLTGLDDRLGRQWLSFSYVALAVVLALCGWLIFFKN
jgi:uncharacterized membrane protein